MSSEPTCDKGHSPPIGSRQLRIHPDEEEVQTPDVWIDPHLLIPFKRFLDLEAWANFIHTLHSLLIMMACCPTVDYVDRKTILRSSAQDMLYPEPFSLLLLSLVETNMTDVSVTLRVWLATMCRSPFFRVVETRPCIRDPLILQQLPRPLWLPIRWWKWCWSLFTPFIAQVMMIFILSSSRRAPPYLLIHFRMSWSLTDQGYKASCLNTMGWTLP